MTDDDLDQEAQDYLRRKGFVVHKRSPNDSDGLPWLVLGGFVSREGWFYCSHASGESSYGTGEPLDVGGVDPRRLVDRIEYNISDENDRETFPDDNPINTYVVKETWDPVAEEFLRRWGGRRES